MRKTDSHELAEALLTKQNPLFDPFTGTNLAEGAPSYSPGQAAGLEPPRFCQLCGRRMVVQVRPDGWTAQCSRHGEVDSILLDDRR